MAQLDTLPLAYRRLPFALPLVIAFSVIGIVVMRTVHFIGIENLFHLMIGTYHRPVLEQKVLLFLDINNSTGLAERLGAVQIKSLVGKFLFDISKPITDYGGEIYLYKGDGLIALWNWSEAIRGNRILRAIDAVFASVRREQAAYQRLFGVVPAFSGRGAWRRGRRQRARRHQTGHRRLRQHDQYSGTNGRSGQSP